MTPRQDASPVIQLRLGDGATHRGFLGVGELKELRRLTGMGPVKLSRAMAEDPDPEHIAEVVRLALIGGGTKPEDALGLAQYYCQPPRPMETAWIAAMAILGAWWRGIPSRSTAQPEDDINIARWEADAARCGISIEALHKMSVGEWFELRHQFTKDADKPPAPDADDLAEMMAAVGG